jgi:hypothetical protein
LADSPSTSLQPPAEQKDEKADVLVSGEEEQPQRTAPNISSADPPNSKLYFSPYRPFGIKYFFNLTVSTTETAEMGVVELADRRCLSLLSAVCSGLLRWQDAIDDCPEYLVPMSVLQTLCAEYGLELMSATPLHRFLVQHIDNPQHLQLLRKMKVRRRCPSPRLSPSRFAIRHPHLRLSAAAAAADHRRESGGWDEFDGG